MLTFTPVERSGDFSVTFPSPKVMRKKMAKPDITCNNTSIFLTLKQCHMIGNTLDLLIRYMELPLTVNPLPRTVCAHLAKSQWHEIRMSMSKDIMLKGRYTSNRLKRKSVINFSLCNFLWDKHSDCITFIWSKKKVIE